MRAITRSLARGCGGALLLCHLACISCSSAPQASAHAVPIVEILAPVQPTAISAEDLAPRLIGSTRWQHVDAQWRPTGGTPTILAATAAEGGGRELCADGIDGTIDSLSFRSDGSLQLLRTDSVRDDARTTFDPPLLLAPPVLRGESEFISDASMQVDAMSSGRERDKGSARRTLRVVRGERIRTPIGEWDATVVESVFTATLGMAVATHRTTLWIVPDVGSVIERWEASVKVLGVPVPRDRGTAVRIDPLPHQLQAPQPHAPR